MKLSDDDLKSLWRQDTARTAHTSPDCLSTDTLARAGADELSANEQASVADHLSRCADCAEEYQIARSTRAWAAQTATNHADAFPSRHSAAAPSLNWRQRLRRVFPLAGFSPPMAVTMAALLIVSILLGAWLLNVRQQNRALVARLNQQGSAAAENVALQTRVGELQREQSALSARMAQQQSSGQEESKVEIEKLKNQLAELTRPQLDVPQIDVDPNNETRGAGSGAKAPVTAINVPAAASSFTINLPGAGSKPFPHYLIELLEAKTNKVVWSARRRQDKETTFTLTLMKRSLPPGKYRIRVSGLNGKQPELLGNYDIQVSFQSQPGNPAGIR